MAAEDVSGAELGLLVQRGKNVISRLLTGQFVRLDPRLQRDISRVTNGVVGPEQWAAFLSRRLEDRQCAADSPGSPSVAA